MPHHSPAMPDLLTGTVTFLFTDIEASTRLLDELGPHRYADALAQHRTLVRDAVVAREGVDRGTEGDSFFCVFMSAPNAVAAAADAQRALQRHDWPESAQLRVRMGLHTGTPLVTDDYVGVDVHRAARIMSAGHGGQVLMSQTTRDLVAEHLPVGTSLRDLGEHRLKDLGAAQRLYQLLVEGLRADFPPLKTLERRQTNLPAQPTPLIGRNRELGELVDLLSRSEVRLVTLTGPGGTGKTRLALQLGAEALDSFADGVFFVPLAPVREPALVLPVVAETLGLREQPGQSIDETLVEFLRDKELLLLLDNLEQLVDVAPRLAEVLAHVPRLKVVATSRSPLRVAAEQHYPLETLADDDALELFLARARAVRPDFVLDGTHSTVVEICRRLDNLPLAIELAASRVRAVPPDAILKRLETRLKLLTGGARELPERQQTLRAAIDWSYDLLSEDERTLFRRLAVFVGGWTLDAGEAVCDPLGDLSMDVLDGLTSLVDKSLVRPGREVEGEPRFWMLQTIREYAAERLEESGELEQVSRRHAEHFLAVAEQGAKVAYGGEQAEWWTRLDAEHDNEREALVWAVDNEREIELRLVNALWYFWSVRGHLSEGRRWLEGAIAGSDPAHEALRARAASAAGALAYRQGDYERARTLADATLELNRELGDELETARALGELGNIAVALGKYEQALAKYAESSELLRKLDDRGRLAQVLANMGAVANMRGDYDEGRRLTEEALALQRESGNVEAATISLHNLARIDLRMGRTAAAADLLHQSLDGARQLDYRELIAYCLEACFELAVALRNPDHAARFLGSSDALFAELGVPMSADEAESYEATARILEEELGDERVAAGRAVGRATAVADMVADALQFAAAASRELQRE
jgi:predicted ATPase/class 3 adenylate cyclase/Tfp pilus assembly protein PilF